MLSSTLNTRSYADDCRIFLLGPGIRELRESKGNRNTLDVVLYNLYRQMEMWKNDYSSLPRRGLEYDPGLPKEEAGEMYKKLDGVFKEVFPSQNSLERKEAAEYMKGMISKVYAEICEQGPAIPGCKQHLTVFLERWLAALDQPRA